MFGTFLYKWFSHRKNLAKYNKKYAKESKFSKFFLNRYTAIGYALIAWHCFGYFVLSIARKGGKIEGNFESMGSKRAKFSTWDLISDNGPYE
jgi:hypothetical protein